MRSNVDLPAPLGPSSPSDFAALEVCGKIFDENAIADSDRHMIGDHDLVTSALGISQGAEPSIHRLLSACSAVEVARVACDVLLLALCSARQDFGGCSLPDLQ